MPLWPHTRARAELQDFPLPPECQGDGQAGKMVARPVLLVVLVVESEPDLGLSVPGYYRAANSFGSRFAQSLVQYRESSRMPDTPAPQPDADPASSPSRLVG